MPGTELLLTGTSANALEVSTFRHPADKHRVPCESALLPAFKSSKIAGDSSADRGPQNDSLKKAS